jgi:hypothetical protein
MSCLSVCCKRAIACPVVSVLRAIWAVSLESIVLGYATGTAGHFAELWGCSFLAWEP